MPTRDVPEEMGVKLRRAAPLFATRGFEATRIEDIARATDIPSSTLYYYFGGKHEVLTFLVHDYLGLLATAVATSARPDAGAVDQLGSLFATHLRVMASHPATCQLLLSELGRIGSLPDVAEAVQSAVHRPLEKILREGAASAELVVGDVEVATSALYGAMTMAALHHIVAGEDFQADDLAKQVLAIVLDGLRG